MHYHDQAMDTMVKGWTRIDMLIALYDRSISAIEMAQNAKEAGDSIETANRILEANRMILGLHSGLNTDKYPLAVDVARLLNFVTLRLGEQRFDEAIHFLDKLRTSFSQIREEAAALEKTGSIPPLVEANALDTTA